MATANCKILFLPIGVKMKKALLISFNRAFPIKIGIGLVCKSVLELDGLFFPIFQ